jgi:hypothetical protein
MSALKKAIDEIESQLTEIETNEIGAIIGGIRPNQLRIVVDYMRRRRESRMRDIKVIDTVEKIEIEEEGRPIVIYKGTDIPLKTFAQHRRQKAIMSQLQEHPTPSRSRAIYDKDQAERLLRGFVRVLEPRNLRLHEFIRYVKLDHRGKQAFYWGGYIVKRDDTSLGIAHHNIIYTVPYICSHNDIEFATVFFRRQDFSEDEFVPLKNLIGDINNEMSIIKQL